jgi:hypothetical protein
VKIPKWLWGTTDGETQTGGASSETEIIANLGTRSQNTYWERKYIDADNAVPRSVHFGINEALSSKSGGGDSV